MVRRIEGWTLPWGCHPALGEQKRKWTSPRGVGGRWGQLAEWPWGQRRGRDH